MAEHRSLDADEREAAWCRSKDIDERWPRFAADVPPELAAELDEHARRFRMQHGRLSRASMVRAALRLYLNTVEPAANAPIEGTAIEVPDVELPELLPAWMQ
jgi:hypothetical protein